MVKVMAAAMVLLLMAIVLMGVKAFFVKGGKFPTGHVHDLPLLKSKKTQKNK